MIVSEELLALSPGVVNLGVTKRMPGMTQCGGKGKKEKNVVYYSALSV